MAEIQTINSSQKRGVHRIIKKSTRVDLTPMVDLGFLLITFFVFTSELSKPKVMDIVSPVDNEKTTPVCASCVLTLILEKDNSIAYYEGLPGPGIAIKKTSFTIDGLRNVLQLKMEAVKNKLGTTDKMVVIIKPSERSLYKNFVDILDEININGIKHYYIDEVNDLDKKQLSRSL